MGAGRVEIEGPADNDLAALKRMGCANTEIVANRGGRARISTPSSARILVAARQYPNSVISVFVPEYIDLGRIWSLASRARSAAC